MKSNYALHYRIEVSRDSLSPTYYYHSKDDESAIETATKMIQSWNDKNKQEIREGTISSQDWEVYKPSLLERITHEIKEVEVRHRVPMKGDAYKTLKELLKNDY